jgi:hypothetical protein
MWLRLRHSFKHFNPDRIEHCGYLVVVALAEHTAMRWIALIILCGVVGTVMRNKV